MLLNQNIFKVKSNILLIGYKIKERKFKMENREILLKKIEAQTKKWEANIKHLQAKAANLDADARIEYEKHMLDLKMKLKEAEKHSDKFKKTSADSWRKLGDDMTHAWNDLVTNIDNAILRLKK